LKGYGSEYSDVGTALVCNHAQHIILGGEFSHYGGSPPVHGTVYFDSFSATSAGNADIFMASINSSSGNVEWLKRYGNTGNEYCRGLSVDSSDNIYMTGMFDWQINFDAYVLQSISTGSIIYDDFVAKFNPNGLTQWAKPIGGVNSGSSIIGSLVTSDISVTPSGNLYIIGSYQGCAMKFHNLSTLPYQDQFEVFLAKYTTTGDFAWAKHMGGVYIDASGSVFTDEYENVYPIGSFEGNAIFGNDTITAINYKDIFIAKYDSSGQEQWVTKAGGNAHDNGIGVTCSEDGNTIYVCGNFYSSSLHYGSDSLVNSGGSDMYIAKLTQTNTGIANNNKAYEVAVYPNPTTGAIHITTPERGYAQAVLYDVTGREVMRQRIDAEKTTMQTGALANGVYYLQLKGEGQMTTEKVIIQH